MRRRKIKNAARMWAIHWLRDRGHDVRDCTSYVGVAWLMIRSFPRIQCYGDYDTKEGCADFLVDLKANYEKFPEKYQGA